MKLRFYPIEDYDTVRSRHREFQDKGWSKKGKFPQQGVGRNGMTWTIDSCMEALSSLEIGNPHQMEALEALEYFNLEINKRAHQRQEQNFGHIGSEDTRDYLCHNLKLQCAMYSTKYTR